MLPWTHTSRRVYAYISPASFRHCRVQSPLLPARPFFHKYHQTGTAHQNRHAGKLLRTPAHALQLKNILSENSYPDESHCSHIQYRHIPKLPYQRSHLRKASDPGSQKYNPHTKPERTSGICWRTPPTPEAHPHSHCIRSWPLPES